MKDDLIDSIKSRGYWRVNIRPITAVETELALSACHKIVEQSSVSLRGWDYPHIPHREGDDTGTERHDNFVQAWTDWMGHREFWRMYTSGQFLHYRALQEDWLDRESWSPPVQPRHWGRPIEDRVFGVGSNLWFITEVYEFASRLVQVSEFPAEGVAVSLIFFSGDESRQLWIEDGARVPFNYERTTNARSIKLESVIDKISNIDPRVEAEKTAAHFFERFGWTPKSDQLRVDIDRLYNL